jgi:hypothetical protein
VALDSEYLKMNFCELKVMPLLDFWAWNKAKKDKICLNASKSAESCTDLIAMIFS